MTFSELVNLALSVNSPSTLELDDLTLEVDGEEFTAYEVSIAYRDLLFFTDKGALTFVIDSYGNEHIAELVSIDK